MGKVFLFFAALILLGTQDVNSTRPQTPINMILGVLQGSKDGFSLRHPESGGKCLEVGGARAGNRVYLATCTYSLFGITPVYQRYYLLPGSTSDSKRLKHMYSYFNNCIYTGSNYNDPLYTTSCSDHRPGVSFRFLEVEDREPRVLVEHMGSGRCLKPDGDYILAVTCDEHDTQQHWIGCKSEDSSCGF